MRRACVRTELLLTRPRSRRANCCCCYCVKPLLLYFSLPRAFLRRAREEGYLDRRKESLWSPSSLPLRSSCSWYGGIRWALRKAHFRVIIGLREKLPRENLFVFHIYPFLITSALIYFLLTRALRWAFLYSSLLVDFRKVGSTSFCPLTPLPPDLSTSSPKTC